ncbi:MAG: hypothetical protein KAH20_15890 [Methylococcales bacterium]|nr:hypothetical protein [Methylococcales bacterium]
MPMNKIQFQPELSMPELIQKYGTEAQCEEALVKFGGLRGFAVQNATMMPNGAYHALDFNKDVYYYLAVIAYQFNRRFILKTLPERLLIAAATTQPRQAAWLRLVVNPC